MTRLVCSLWILALISACASSPEMRFYTLNDVAPKAAPAGVRAEGLRVHLSRVTIPGELDRSQLVRRVDANRLQIAELDRWAAPLDEIILRVLAADLAARLPAGTMTNSAAPASGAQTRQLSVDIQELIGDRSCGVTLRAAWTLTLPEQPAAQGMADVEVPSGGPCAAAALPAAMSQAVAELSDSIAASIAQGPN